MNNSRIETLPQSVADRIAAGEVVERPAAVVKELIENSLDAGATAITVAIIDAGRTLIRVVDDGFGMTPGELTAAIGRHSTSKLRRFEDLESLVTFGFRGEALPSIAAVSRLEIVSRARGEEVGARLRVNGGVVETCEPAACPPGTSTSISHLFHNVPARRKFLRSDTTEFKWIATVFKHFVLAFPGVKFELYRGNSLVYSLPAAEPRQRIAGIFGDDLGEDMIEIDSKSGYFTVSGFITPPTLTPRTGAEQYLFVNRRPIVSIRLHKAVLNAVEPYLTSGGQPVYVINISAPPDRFDINVHPAKKEIKFADEQGAFAAVWGAVRQAIGASRTPAELTSGNLQTTAPPTSSGRQSPSERIPIASPPHLTPYTSIPRHHLAPPRMPFPANTRPDAPVSPDILPDELDKATGQEVLSETTGRLTDEGPFIFQLFDTYLVSPLTTGLVFVDQHVAHERILYERALTAMEKMPWISQQLLFPTTFAVGAEDVPLVEEMLPLLRAMGFEVEPFGPREFRITSVPSGITISNERAMLLGIIDDLRSGQATGNDPRQRLAAAFACRGAVKAGQPLEPEERRRLIDELFTTTDPEFCPHGRPIYHVLAKREIEKWFKR